MALGSSLFSVCVLVICMVAAARYSSGGKSSCPCPTIPPVTLTEPPPTTCFQIDDRFRYKCKTGYVRKAGTSNLITCKKMNGASQWTPVVLQCIPDPSRPPTDAPEITVTTDPMRPTMQAPELTVTTDPWKNTTAPTKLTVTMASSTFQMTNYVAEITSVGPQVLSDHSHDLGRKIEESTMNEPSNSNPSKQNVSSTTTAVSTLVLLLIVCVVAGTFFICYKRRSSNKMPQHSAEEGIPMNTDPSVVVK